MGSKSWKSAEELAAELRLSLDRRRDLKRRDAVREEQVVEAREAQRELIADLAEHGIHVEDIREIRAGSSEYRKATPILVKWLQAADSLSLKEAIVRALTSEQVDHDVAADLLEEFRKSEDGNLRWLIGNAVSLIAEPSLGSELAAIAAESRYGRSREMVVVALGRLEPSPDLVSLLRRLTEDPEVAGHAAMALGSLGTREADEELRRLLSDKRGWVRAEAQRALEHREAASTD
jgi:hypothetical protein